MTSGITLVSSSVDRLAEASFHLRQMECSYHCANRFRWSLNCFLRSLKEIPQIIQMELQSQSGFGETVRPNLQAIRSDPLIRRLGEKRDIVVHREMLLPASTGAIGVSEGRGLKYGIGGFGIDPLQDSDVEMMRYVRLVAEKSDVLDLLRDDEDSCPCVQREWKLDEFPDVELTELASRAWEQMARLLSGTVVWLGGEELSTSFERSAPHRVRLKMYDRNELKRLVVELKANISARSESEVSGQ